MQLDIENMIDASDEGVLVATRLLTVLFLLGHVVAACSSASSAGSRPSGFDDMTSDEVGCTVRYGDTDPYVVGPLGSSDFKVIEPNDYTSFRIARTASDIVIVAELSNSGANQSTPLDDMPPDGIVVRGPFRHAGNLGYVVTCWRGES